MTTFHDTLETRDPAEREAALMAALPGLIAHAQQNTAAFADILSGVDPRQVNARAALAQLPVTRKGQLRDRQNWAQSAGGDPFGGFSAVGWRTLGARSHARRVFQSPGPIYEPEGSASDYWRFGRALFAAGVREGDLIHNSFSYHLTPAGSMIETAAQALGCAVFPGGVGNTELQLQAMQQLRPRVYAGTPSFLRIALEKADASGISLPHLGVACVSGEALPIALRQWFQSRGIEAYQNYGTADLGMVAYETEARQGLVLDEQVLLEIVMPGTGTPVPEGEVGEVVVTVLNPAYPLIRFGTGDLSALLPGHCPTGRTNTRIRGWMGRADQVTKVRGMFIYPKHVEDVMRRHPAILRARFTVEGEMANDELTLLAECGDGASTPDAALVTQSIREVTKLRAQVRWVPVGSLPQDGQLIEDRRQLS